MKRSPEEGEKRFNQLSIEERGKFDEETFVNVNNIKKKSTTSQRSTGFSNEYIVVRLLFRLQIIIIGGEWILDDRDGENWIHAAGVR